MRKFIIAYDNQNTELGHFFTLCKENLVNFLNDKGISNVTEISARYCNQPFIEIQIQSLKSESFFFIAYSHGVENAVVCGNDAYVKANENTHLFNNSLFYSNACLCATGLKADLIQNGCKAFIGSRDSVNVLLLDVNLCAKLDNYALMVFIEQDKTIYEAFDAMKSYYNYEIDKLIELEGGFGIGKAAYLTSARDALDFDGDKQVKFSTF